MMDGKLYGTEKPYPLTLKIADGLGFRDEVIKNQDALIKLVVSEQRKDYNKKKKLSQICDECGIQDTVMLFDERTMQLFEMWSYYKYAPHLINNLPFYDANVVFNIMLGQRMI